MWRGALGRVAGIEIGHTRAFRRLWQELHHHAAGSPAVPRPARLSAQLLCDGEAHARWNLFRTQEIFMSDVLERAAVERDEALIAAHVGPLIDRHRKMALAEQTRPADTAGFDRSRHAGF